jgi:hypothetical protein
MDFCHFSIAFPFLVYSWNCSFCYLLNLWLLIRFTFNCNAVKCCLLSENCVFCYLLDHWLLIRFTFNCKCWEVPSIIWLLSIYGCILIHMKICLHLSTSCNSYMGILLVVHLNLDAHNRSIWLLYLGWLLPLALQLFVGIDYAILLGYRIGG